MVHGDDGVVCSVEEGGATVVRSRKTQAMDTASTHYNQAELHTHKTNCTIR